MNIFFLGDSLLVHWCTGPLVIVGGSVAAGVAGGETLLIGRFGRCLDMTGTVGAAATVQLAGRRATDVITGSTIHHAKHGLNGHNRNNLHNGWGLGGCFFDFLV